MTLAIRTTIARALGRLGFSPNALTLIGYLLNVPVMLVLAGGHWRWGGILVALASAFDALDGTLARDSNQTTLFGAFFDSVLDRFSEATVLFGLLYWYVQQGARLEPILIYITIVGSLMVSYTRARAEGLGLECKTGWMTRFERVVILVLALLLGRPTFALAILAILTLWTSIQRILYVWQTTAHGAAK